MLFEDRPKIKLQKSNSFRFFEILPFILLFLGLILNAFVYSKLPEKIPIHFNFYGELDAYGNKNSVWLLSAIGFVLAYISYRLLQHPHIFNYAVKITEENAERHYRSAVKMMVAINIIIALLFLIINIEIVNNALNNGKEFSEISLYIINGLLISTVAIPIVILIKSLKKN